jgi:hypothetical protein
LYEQQILRILLDVGVRGISVKKLAKHVYNHNCTFFSQPDFVEVYRSVQNFVQRNSRSSQGLIEHAEKWGYYRLNTGSSVGQQLMLEFQDEKEDEDEKSEKPVVDLSLSLF